MDRGIVIATLLFTGCVAPMRYVDFPRQKLSFGLAQRQSQLNDACWVDGSKWDDGTPVLKGQNYGACYDREKDRVYLMDCPHVQTVLHEFCHREGLDEKHCEKEYK